MTRRAMLSGLTAAVLLSAAAWPARDAKEPRAPELAKPLTPAAERDSFRLAKGLRIELVASEPQIESPVAMAFDENGRLWVVEMRDYPNGPAPGQPPEGRIKVLEDRDGDGFYEHGTVFAEKLLFANGLLPWKDGAIVTAAPHVVWLRDTDGDGKADAREVLYEGFAAQNPQLRVSHPVLGPDGWIYVANGLRGGQVIRAGRKDAVPINLGGMDFRFDPVHDRAEAISGMGQFGNTFDDWGNRFVCDNRHHLRHIVLPTRYLKRNPNLAVPRVVNDTSELDEGPLSSGGQVYPLSRNWTTSNLHAGRFTAACGVFVYRGSLLPAEFQGSAFTCEPTGNLVHREVLVPQGASFRSHPVPAKAEFLATPDEWFRPVSLAHGPDGALYVVDMYRAVIEHPDFMPPELKKRPDLNLGKDKGRIWRIVPEEHQSTNPRPALAQASTAELVGKLGHPEVWWRTTAQRLLVQRQDRAAVEPLKELCVKSGSPHARLQAAWLLDGLRALDADLALRLLQDPHPRVQQQAILLAERFLPESAPIRDRALRLARHRDAQVRFQAALSLGQWDDERILPALALIATQGADDSFTRAAVASSVPKRSGALLALLLRPDQLTGALTRGRLDLVHELAAVVGARQDAAEVGALLAALGKVIGVKPDRWQTACLQGLGAGIGRRGKSLGAFLKTLPTEQRPAVEAAEKLLRQAGDTAADPKRELNDRVEAAALLAHAPPAIAEPILRKLVSDEPTPELRLAAVRALAALTSPEIPKFLLEGWGGYTPAVRREVTEALLRQPDRVRLLLAAVEAGRVKPRELDAPSVRRLTSHPQADIRQKATKLLRAALPEDRKKVLEQYRAALARTGDAKRGREVFRQHCAACHRIEGVGHVVGPDISDTRTKTPEMLLLDILNPNAAIDANYVSYLVTLKNGKSTTGLIVADTAASLTLRRGENQTEVILRQDIEEVRSTGQSLMPDGIEKNVSVEQMADLLAYLKNWRYLDGKTPLGEKTP